MAERVMTSRPTAATTKSSAGDRRSGQRAVSVPASHVVAQLQHSLGQRSEVLQLARFASALQSPLPSRPVRASRRRIPGGPAVVQRVLGVNNPIVRPDVANVDQKGGKLVFVLTGHAADSVVVKFEMPGGAETVPQLGARRDALYALSRTVLDNVPEATLLTPPELNALQQLDPTTVTGDVAVLVGMLQGGLAQQAVSLKVETVAVGDSLEDMIGHNNVTPSLLSPTMLRQFGKMAFFDLLVSNTDRFRPDGDVNVQNIDFVAGGGQALPLDNLDPFGGGIPTTLAQFEGRAAVADKSARRGYAMNALITICAKAGRDVPVKQLPALVDLFAAGMEDAAKQCKAQQKGFERTAFKDPATIDTPAGHVAEGLAARLNVIKA